MQKVRTWLYMGIYISGVVLGWLLLALSMGLFALEDTSHYSPVVAVVWLCSGLLGFIFLLVALVVEMIVVYKMWAAIGGPSARTTPGKAVGFLFIPVFSLYWEFQVYWGWAKDYNKIVIERQLNVPLMSTGLGLTIPILNILGWIPYVGWLLGLAIPVLRVIFLSKACTCVNVLCDAGVTPYLLWTQQRQNSEQSN
ncbi:MAG: hypothetical protein LLF92_04785 [Planctomycetaceae bacterium]|nr:hypothetical protein [Planctomycetaceae bacterium]